MKAGAILNGFKLDGASAQLFGLIVYLLSGVALTQTLSVSIDTASATYAPGTTFNGFRAQTDNPLGPFAAAGVQFSGLDAGGASKIYRYRLDFDSIVELGSIVISGAGWDGSTLALRDVQGNDLAGQTIDSFGNEFQSVLFDVSGISGTSFMLEERNSVPTWRFRSLVSVALGDGSRPQLMLGDAPSNPPLAKAEYSDGNGHEYLLVELPGSDWETARRHVLANYPGFDLATVTSAAEQLFTNAFLARNSAHLNWWLGGRQATDPGGSPTGEWQWATGEPWSFENWIAGQSENIESGRYLAMVAGSRASNWNAAEQGGNGIAGYVAESHYSGDSLNSAGLAGRVLRTGGEGIVDLRPSDSPCINRFAQNIETPMLNAFHLFHADDSFPSELVASFNEEDVNPGEFVFAVEICDGGNFDYYFSGPAARNVDGFAHAIVTPTASSQPLYPHAAIIAFVESMSDSSFNDFVIEVSQEDVFPEPAVNSLPLAVDDSESTLAGVGVAVDVLRNDIWLDDPPFIVQLASLPKHGAAFVASENIVSYVPPAGFVGVESFRYTLTDRDGDSTQATLTVTVDSGPQTGGVAGGGLLPPPEFPSSNGGGGALSLLAVLALAILANRSRSRLRIFRNHG